MKGRTVSIGVVFAALLLAGCASQPTQSATARRPTPPRCAELADEVIGQVQVVVDELSDATLDDLERDDLISAQAQQRLDGLEAQVDEAGCYEDEMDGLLAERADRIQGDGVVAEAVRKALGQNGELPFSTQG
jgi:hypothetical protein